MKTFIGFLTHKLTVQITGIAALCTLIWFVGPKFAFAQKALLASSFNRLLGILVVIACWALYNLIQQTRSNNKEKQLMADLAAEPADPESAAVEQTRSKEADDLRQKFKQALQLLKQTRSKGRHDKQYVYELPWYVIIGAPGCGKTTLLANSGLHFPLAGKLDGDEVQGVGGTRNCNWLFTDEAVFIDTAGRYTTQDSHQSVDASAWQGFLALIKKYRPRRPMNGVLVAVSISDLLQQTDEQSRQQADIIRQRITELYEELGVRFPIYMMFTKCDLVAGFTDTFDHLNATQRAQVWGETFRDQESARLQALIDRYIADFDTLLGGLHQWSFERIQHERDIQRRSLIMDFPHQLALLKPKIGQFLHQVFSTSSFDASTPMLRGVYLTSGTQEGTPIDRVMGVLASTYGLDRYQVPVFSGRGKSYFITRLLKEVIFPEAQLAGVDPRVERRRQWMRLAAYGGALVLVAGIIGLWTTSYLHNQADIRRIEQRIDQYRNVTDDDTTWDKTVKSIVARMNIISAADAVCEKRSIWTGFGLSPADKLRAGIGGIYSRLLTCRFLPMIKARLEQRIHTHLFRNSSEDSAVLYELLKTYLMLGRPQEHLEPELAQRCISSDWYQSFTREPEVRHDLNRHTGRLLHLALNPIQLNDPLIAEARYILNTQPLYAQIFAHLNTQTQADPTYDFRLSNVLPPNSDKVFVTVDGRELKALTIPRLFTYEGYHGIFAPKGLQYVRQALTENWVLNNYAADQAGDLDRLYDDLQKFYFDQYAKQWRGLLDNIKIRKAQGISQEIQILDILSGSRTPLRPLMASVEKHTTLYRTVVPDTSVGSDATAPKTSTMEQVPGKQSASVHVLELEKRFSDIHYLVRSSGDAPPPLDHLLTGLNSVRDFMMQIDNAADSDEKALSQALERIRGGGASESIKAARMEFARQPEPLKSWLAALTSSSIGMTLASAKSELNATWKTDVVRAYKAALQGRYPIYKYSAYDITVDDFSRFFMPNGILDQFLQQHLKPFIDTTQPQWRPRKIDDQAMSLSADLLQQLQYAATIRDAFFAGGTTIPKIRFELKPIDLDDQVALFSIDIEGQIAEYRHGPTRSTPFEWPGPDSDTGVRFTVRTIDGQQISYTKEGPWAWLRTLNQAVVTSSRHRDSFTVMFRVGSHWARYQLRTSSVHHPFQLDELQQFRCPESF